MKAALLILFCLVILGTQVCRATSNYTYGADEYVTIANGISPDGKYAITAHGDGNLGYDNFHIYLTNAVTGKKIGPLEEVLEQLDTGADAYGAIWSKDSQFVTIVYRIDRHEPLQVVSYRIGHGRAFPLKGPVDANEEQTTYWGKNCGTSQPPTRIFGKARAHPVYDGGN
jgi:hypothetical protein